MDEAHTIRNVTNQLFKCISSLEGVSKWAITGTPIQNNLNDFFGIISFLQWRPFNDKNVYTKYITGDKSFGDKRMLILGEFIMLRRTKNDKEIAAAASFTLTGKRVQLVMVHLDEEERIAYECVLRFSKKMFKQYMGGRDKRKTNFMCEITWMHVNKFYLNTLTKGPLKCRLRFFSFWERGVA